MMNRKQFTAHQEKEKQEKCEKLNRTAFEIRAKVVPMTEEELMEEKRARLNEKVAKFGAKVVPLTEGEAEAAKREEEQRQRQKLEDRQTNRGRNAHSLMQPLLSHHLKNQKENKVKEVEVVDEQTEEEKEKTCLRGRV